MIEKPKLLLLVILITLVGILGIYTYAVLIEAKTISISDLGSKHLGSLVEVEGYIKEVNEWQDGDLNLILVDYESGKTIDVNVDADATENLAHQEKLIPGAKIRVNGLVEDYKGDLFIHVMSSEGIELVQTTGKNLLPLDVILERPDVFEGVEVQVGGEVRDIGYIESLNAFTFTLRNSSSGYYYSISCIVFDMSVFRDKGDNSIQNGDEITFHGTFEYYAQNGIWQIQSDEGKESLEKVD
jgi:DNA/RNA endonuclease YhcR with UshA esterase domain